MSLTRPVLMGLALVMLASCRAHTLPTSTPTPALPSELDLQSTLLTTSDLPSGWSVLATEDRNSFSTPQCDADGAPPRHVEATVIFQQPDDHLELFETIAAFNPGAAKQWLDAIQPNTNCKQTRNVIIQGTPTTVISKTSPLSIAAMGDQMLSLRETTIQDANSGDADLVYVRVGDFIVLITNTRPDHAGAVPTASLVQKALDKLKSSRLSWQSHDGLT